MIQGPWIMGYFLINDKKRHRSCAAQLSHFAFVLAPGAVNNRLQNHHSSNFQFFFLIKQIYANAFVFLSFVLGKNCVGSYDGMESLRPDCQI